MKLRRCAILCVEPQEQAVFELAGLFRGETGIVSTIKLVAHAPHLPKPIEIDEIRLAVLGSLSPVDWVDAEPLEERHGAEIVQSLLCDGLLIGKDDEWNQQCALDDTLRAHHWHGLAAVFHGASRWQGKDALRELREEGVETSVALRNRFGEPPPAQVDRGDESTHISLPRSVETDFDKLLDTRDSCRNFDANELLSKTQFSLLLERVFSARAQVPAADGFEVLKKSSPSGGALHPTEAYLIVQRVEGIEPGLYHYRPIDHALRRLPWNGTPEELEGFARTAVAGQHYFANAHVLVVLASRFGRNFWKYRKHSKAYRVCILDVGHLSQTLLLCATEQHLGAFVTAAINEVDVENAFGLEGCIDGPLAICGFGIRASVMSTYELDPKGKIWPLG